MSLWYPSSYEEFQFVSKKYHGIEPKLIQVGIRAVDRDSGILHSDYSISMGIPFVTHDPSGEPRFPSLSNQSLMNRTRCIILNMATGALELMEPCPNTVALCREKIGTHLSHPISKCNN